jgi:hypothetical protein
MLSIDGSRAGEHRQAFHGAAKRFWRMYQSESFSMWANGIVPEGLRMSVQAYGQEEPDQFIVRLGSDPEESIPTALERWWASRSQ